MNITGMPALAPINSTALKACAYEHTTQTLFLQFPSGNVYSYADVSAELWASFQAAESKGKFYGQHIKGKLTGSPVKPDAAADDGEGSSAD